MSIQITNDPINQFLDNLPRYALEMRRQDAQREQFDRQQRFREEALKASEARADRAETRANLREARAERGEQRQKRLLDLTLAERQTNLNNQQFMSDMFREKINTASRMREAERVARDFQKDYESEINNYENRFFSRLPVKLGLMSGSFEDYLKFQRSITPPALRGRLDKALVDYKNLKDNYNPIDIKPKNIPIPDNVFINPSLYEMTTNYNNLQKSKTSLLNDLFNTFNDNTFKVDNDFMMNLQKQQAEAER
jgi:hypothetical protein